MEPLTILYTDPLDLLFENRNKLYGAYPLRKYYRRRLFTAIGIVLGMVLIFASGLIFFRDHQTVSAVFEPPDTHLTSVVLIPPPILNERVFVRPAAAVKHVAAVIVTNPLIVKAQFIDKPMADIDQVKIAAIGLRTEAGAAAVGGPDEHSGTAGVAGTREKDSIESSPEILDRAQLMPEFPGGQEALRRYLSRNLRMPDTEKEPGTQIRVIVKFVVGPDGKVTGINTVQSGGRAFDEAVQRVISRMPTWKPGMQNGRKVSVYYNLPVNFVIPADN